MTPGLEQNNTMAETTKIHLSNKGAYYLTSAKQRVINLLEITGCSK